MSEERGWRRIEVLDITAPSAMNISIVSLEYTS
jgi:hypothetical protein